MTFGNFIKSMLIAATTTSFFIFGHPTFLTFTVIFLKKIYTHPTTHTIMHIHRKADGQHQV